jgi:hypothetical protein
MVWFVAVLPELGAARDKLKLWCQKSLLAHELLGQELVGSSRQDFPQLRDLLARSLKRWGVQEPCASIRELSGDQTPCLLPKAGPVAEPLVELAEPLANMELARLAEDPEVAAAMKRRVAVLEFARGSLACGAKPSLVRRVLEDVPALPAEGVDGPSVLRGEARQIPNGLSEAQLELVRARVVSGASSWLWGDGRRPRLCVAPPAGLASGEGLASLAGGARKRGRRRRTARN